MPEPRTLPLLAPMLATGVRDLPRDTERFSAEFKWDGMRCLATIHGGEVLLRSRTGRDITSTYPELAVLGQLAGRRQLILDGEIVTFRQGRPDFARLQRRMHVPAPRPELTAAVPAAYLIFDLLYRGTRQMIHQPYTRRRAALEELGLHIPGLVEVPPAFYGDAGAVAAAAATLQLEGVVLKRLTARYRPGRSQDWLKIKRLTAADVIVGGWLPHRRSGLPGALLIGTWGPAGLEFAGTASSGLSAGEAHQLGQLLAMLQVPRAPFARLPRWLERAALFAEPVLVGEVAYAQAGARGVMRHPVWRGLRPG